MEIFHKELTFQSMVEASPVALILINGRGKINYLNRRAEQMFLYHQNELIGQNLDILIADGFRINYKNRLNALFSETTKRQTGENVEISALKKNGDEFPVLIDMNPITIEENTLVIVSILDITERIKANEQFRLVVESAPNAIILTDKSGKIVMINRRTEILFGYQSNELLGKSIEILVPERLKHTHHRLRNEYNSKPQVRSMGAGRDLYAIRKDGKEIPIEIGLNPIKKTEGDLVLASIIDITERKKNEEAFKLYTKRIEDKNRELEQYTYIASHDLREPLNSISGLIEILMDNSQYHEDAHLNKILNYINSASNRSRDLVAGILDYTLLGKNAEKKLVDFNKIVSEVLMDLESAVSEANANIACEELPSLPAYEVEIRLLFQNLISNAIKYRKKDTSPEIHIFARKIKNNWEFSVKDNGIGIPESQKEKVFLLFQRLHHRRDYDGIGIGLAHCKKIVELHDGQIFVKSVPDEGSTFYFTLPEKTI